MTKASYTYNLKTVVVLQFQLYLQTAECSLSLLKVKTLQKDISIITSEWYVPYL